MGRTQTLSLAITDTTHITSKATLQFRCKVTDTSDETNYISHTCKLKVLTGESPLNYYAYVLMCVYVCSLD